MSGGDGAGDGKPVSADTNEGVEDMFRTVEGQEARDSADEPEVDGDISLAARADDMQETQVNGGGGTASLPEAESHSAAVPTRHISQREQDICDLIRNFAVLLGSGDGRAISSPSPWPPRPNEDMCQEREEIVGGVEPASSLPEGESKSDVVDEMPQDMAPPVAPGAQQRGLRVLLDALNMRVFFRSPFGATSARSLGSLGVERAL
ncbi:unnamed protein product [Prorocentrum cordatum]|uniref:Uncharacterized protein n=1 Tax=Prorocentrum cordatum TaxID=2364126 RepID=A0ABN9WW23_9DINO|nr:unnamed protein product [Polarella glacialis]